MSVNMGVKMCEKLKPQGITHSTQDVIDLEVLEKTLESPLDRKEIKPVNPKGNQP